MKIFSPVVHGLGDAVELHQVRHRVIAENLANAETPGYRARDLDFRDQLRAAFQEGAERADAAALEPHVDQSVDPKVDGNSVDVDYEMARLSDNAFKITALSRLLARRYAGLKATISRLR